MSTAKRLLSLSLCAVAGALAACARGTADEGRTTVAPAADGHLFTRLPAAYTGVRFVNRVEDTPAQNVFTYRNQYNGGGVAIGDLTGDGLPELVLTSNQGGTRLYLNEGTFRFRDVTDAAGVRGNGAWTTGVTLADVNGDGRLDLYVCHAGLDAAKRRNELWINQGPGGDGVPRFTEEAARYGIADGGYGTQAAFFDSDGDGDLDLFVLRNSPKPVTSFGTRNTRTVRDAFGGARLYRNDGARFVDVSAQAGIYGPENAFGLGVVVADVNRDGRPDLYVSHDYYERDYLYLNNGDGTFAEAHDRAFAVGSYFSMGLDAADVDNDGWPDVYTTDMLPEDEHRLKSTTAYEGWDVYQAKVRTGYGHQLMRNMLQRNNGDWSGGDGGFADAARRQHGTFSDVAWMAGVARTDWSWGALIADLDLDGNKDIFVTNGVVRDVTSQDYVAFLADQTTMEAATRGGRVDFMQLVRAMQSTPIPNYAFRNQGADSSGSLPRFVNESAAWGLDAPSFSNGAAYGDLDGDGAPDLVVNNANQEAFVYSNNARALRPANHFLAVRLAGEGANRFGVGARVTVHVSDAATGVRQFVQELAPTRGFESSSDYVLTFGLGAHAAADSVTVEWPDRRVSVLRGVRADQRLTVRHAEAGPAVAALPAPPAPPVRPRLFAAEPDSTVLPFTHRENDFVDFDRERLLPKMLSTEGPLTAVADVNGDGLDDVYLGGAKDQPGALLVQQRDGRFARSNPGVFEPDAISEDAGAVFFDANGDGHPDLYVVSGGNEFSDQAPALQDRLYLNDGRGHFTKAPPGVLPAETVSGSRVVALDVNGDGRMDLFVGGRSVPWRYGESPRSLLLLNDGRGPGSPHFTDATDRLAPGLARVGMVTDAAWADADGDGRPDLVVVGEWMPITVFHNAGGGQLVRQNPPGLAASQGWWNRIVAADVDGDGRTDFVVGNLGRNGRLQASATEPVTMYVKDFLHNGYLEQILATSSGGKAYPFAMRDDLIRAVPSLKARYLKYESYAGQTIADVFPADSLTGAIVREARTLATSVVHNDGGGRFTLVPLPDAAQLAPVYGLVARDLDGDGRLDLLLAGNFDGFKPEIGRMAASQGLFLRGDGRGGFAPVPAIESGFRVTGQVRDLARVRGASGDRYVVARNNDRALVYRVDPRAAAPRTIASTASRRR